jgi:hypothetical protein
MKRNLTVVLAVLGMAFQLTAQPRVVTLTVNQPYQTNNLDIADFEHAKILTALDSGSGAGTVSYVHLLKGNADIAFGQLLGPHNGGKPNDSPAGLVVAGPATISLRCAARPGPKSPALVTVEVCPTAYPVTNSVVLGPGQGGEINLESSTNLIQWIPATNGVYTAEAAMFFRMHLRRIQ